MRRTWAGPAILVAGFLAFCARWLLGSGMIYGADTVTFIYPLREFTFGWIRRGVLPLWNPHIYSGTPNLAGLQCSVLYPPNLAFVFMPSDAAINLSVYLHLALHLAGCYVLFRRWCVGSESAAAGALLATFNPYQITHLYAGHLTPQAVMAWFPWSLLLLERMLTLGGRTGRTSALGLGVIWALQVLGGHPQYLYYSLLLCLIWGAIRFLGRHAEDAPSSAEIGLRSGLVLAAFAGLSAFQLLPTAELIGLAHRAQSRDLAYFGRDALTLRHLPALLFPDFFGNYAKVPFALPGNYWELTGSFGLPALILAIAAVIRGGPGRRAWALIGLGGLLLAFGPNLPGFSLVFQYVPGFGLFRAVGRTLWAWSFSGSLLAAHGIDDILDRTSPLRSEAVPILCGIAFLAVFVAWSVEDIAYKVLPEGNGVLVAGMTFEVNPGQSPERVVDAYWKIYQRSLIEVLGTAFFCLAAWRVLRTSGPPPLPAVMFAAWSLLLVWLFAQPFLRKDPLWQFFSNRQLAGFVQMDSRPGRVQAQWNYQSLNIGMVWDLENIGGANDPLILSSYARYLNKSQGMESGAMRDSAILTVLSPPLADLNRRYLIYPAEAMPAETWFRLRYTNGRQVILEDMSAAPRVSPVSDPARALEYREDEPGHVILTGLPAETDRLVVRDIAYPGWVAEANGARVPIETNASGLFREIALSRPASRIDMRFIPWSFRLGLFLSMVTLCALGAWSSYAWRD